MRPHAVIIPYTGSGHINPMLKLAKLLHSKGCYVTFINTEFSRERILRNEGPNALKGSDEGFRFETIPGSLSPSDQENPQQVLKLCPSTQKSCAAALEELLVKLNDSSDVPPVTCIILNGLMIFSLDVAEKLGVPALVFCTTSACGFMGTIHLGELIKRGYTPLEDERCLTNGYLDTVIDWIPGMKDIRLRDLTSFLRTTDPDDSLLKTEMEETNNTFRAWGLILNTFDRMECNVLDALKRMFPRMYTVGPLSALLNQTTENQWNSVRLSLWEENHGCLQWLDTQRAASVVYVNFGSLTTMTVEQLMEFAWGVADSNHPFMCIIRPDLVAGGLEALPKEFIIKTEDRSFLTSWCPQEEVLSHPAIGCFLTHSGWNSTMESVCGGVPMICWPNFADQYTNCRYADKEWEIGVEIDQEVKREQVMGTVREVMEGERGKEMRKNAMKWKERAEQATRQGGSSYENMERLAKDLNQFMIMRTG
ncbi:7-deoxyloganetin glucosyltransferase-like [Phoenix dactylifera]|uniref:Glycosyltransferase n=1 Tax=Phoenix dactylifera TaxID=42345 RepID=A0A8B7D1A6_PHODC|nr:7-deoxyloganetin glucosyltransferase-like [Phoenix dactylifera]